MSWHARSSSLAIVIDDATIESIRAPATPSQQSKDEVPELLKSKRTSRRSQSVAITQTVNHSMMSPTLSFTAALNVRRMAQASKILTHLKKCPLFYDPSFSLPASQNINQSNNLANRAVLLHKLSRHPSVALLQYPSRTAIIVQSSHPSLVHLLVSGRIRSIRAGLSLMESLSGELIGADCAVFSSESFRRWHRSMLRQRVALHHGDAGSMMSESINRMNHDADIREFEFEGEFKTGVRKRRRAFLAPMSVECIDACEVLVLPKDLLLELVHSSHSLRLHAYQHLLAIHWMRRTLYEQAEGRVSRVYGDQLAEDGHPAIERAVIGSTGFLVHSIIQPSDGHQVRALADAHRKLSTTLDGESHPMCGINRPPGHAIRVKLAANQIAQGGTRSAERKRKRTIKEKVQSDKRADKVKSIISAMQHQRRVSLAANMRLAQEEHEEDPDAKYESESDDDDDSAPDQDIVLDRYFKAVSEQTVVSTPSTKNRFIQRINHHVATPDKPPDNNSKLSSPFSQLIKQSINQPTKTPVTTKLVNKPAPGRPVATRLTGPFVLHPIVDEEEDEADVCSFIIEESKTHVHSSVSPSPLASSLEANEPEEVKLTPVPRINLLLATNNTNHRDEHISTDRTEKTAQQPQWRTRSSQDGSPFVIRNSTQSLAVTQYSARTNVPDTGLTEEQKECLESVIELGEPKRPYAVPNNATKPIKSLTTPVQAALSQVRAQQTARAMSKLKFPLPSDRYDITPHASTSRTESSTKMCGPNGSSTARQAHHKTGSSHQVGSMSARQPSSSRQTQELLAAAAQRHLPWSARLAFLDQAASISREEQ